MAAATLLLLLAALLGPSLPATPAPAAPPRSAEATATQTPINGGTCKQQNAPLHDTRIALPQAHTDPVAGPATQRTPLPPGRTPHAAPPRAPPTPVAGCAELLPVLRI
jgi:hypothetical protein